MFCECGCGRKTNIIKAHHKGQGRVKGEHSRFLKGHHLRKNIDKWVARQGKHICQCGCGDYIVVKSNHYKYGIPRYIHGHHSSVPEFKAERRKYNKAHLGELSSRWVEDRSKVRYHKQKFTKEQKREIYVRDKGICQSCEAFTLINASKNDPLKTNFDHIVLMKNGGKSTVQNGQTLCLICHKLKHSAKAKRMNSGKPRTGNPEPSVQSTKVQRLLEHSDMLNNQTSVLHESDDIVRT